MITKRGGRVQVNMMQYYELVQRVEKLEKALFDRKIDAVKKDSELTNSEIKELLIQREIPFTTKNTKQELLQLLGE